MSLCISMQSQSKWSSTIKCTKIYYWKPNLFSEKLPVLYIVHSCSVSVYTVWCSAYTTGTGLPSCLWKTISTLMNTRLLVVIMMSIFGEINPIKPKLKILKIRSLASNLWIWWPFKVRLPFWENLKIWKSQNPPRSDRVKFSIISLNIIDISDKLKS